MVPTDPFKPESEISFSNSQVKKAGKVIRRFYSAPDGDVHQAVDAMVVITWWRSLHAAPLSKVASGLRYHVAKEGCEGAAVGQRLKKRATIIDKLMREPTMSLITMQDIGGVRTTLDCTKDIYAVSRRLKKNWTIARTYDYIAEPKNSGYRAMHLVVKRDGRLIEVQLRTFRQDAWANRVEEDGRNLGTGFKFGLGPDDIHGYYQAVAEAFAFLDAGVTHLPPDLVERINESHQAVQQHFSQSRAPNEEV